MIAHISLNVSDVKKSKEFYLKTLEPLGYTLSMEFEDAVGFMQGGNTDFWISKVEKPQKAHVAFLSERREDVGKFYDAAIRAGATDNGKPGLRPDYSETYYAAFVYDPDGHNIEAVTFVEE
jgi:catechol 2,3-dioxygenase-like lactoylglutathione lyase family enzyme